MSLNRGSSMTLKCKGVKRSTAHRLRMPWTAAKEAVPQAVLSRRDKAILDAAPLHTGISRLAQLEPLEALKAVAAQYEYNTSTGRNLFQLAAHLPHHGRGQRFFRRDWREGTYDKYVTLASVHFDREGFVGDAYGYVTFHGESSLAPTEIAHADVPGWYVEYSPEWEVPYGTVVAPPPSIGTEIRVDPKRFRLKSYPFYDAPNAPEFVDRLLRERGVLPDMPLSGEGAPGPDAEGGESDGSVAHKAN
jgi:hypothetical protein